MVVQRHFQLSQRSKRRTNSYLTNFLFHKKQPEIRGYASFDMSNNGAQHIRLEIKRSQLSRLSPRSDAKSLKQKLQCETLSYNCFLPKNINIFSPPRKGKGDQETPQQSVHGIKGFVIPTKSFVKIGITKIFCHNSKMFTYINKTFGCCNKSFGYSNKIFLCCP